jgi:hypothetical protein
MAVGLCAAIRSLKFVTNQLNMAASFHAGLQPQIITSNSITHRDSQTNNFISGGTMALRFSLVDTWHGNLDYEFEGEYIDISLLTPSGCELALYRSASNMLAARVGFHPFAEKSSGVLAEFAVFGSKCGGKMAIDVQLADHFARHKNRHDDFGLGLERAG